MYLSCLALFLALHSLLSLCFFFAKIIPGAEDESVAQDEAVEHENGSGGSDDDVALKPANVCSF